MLYLIVPRAAPILAAVILSLVATPYWQRVLISASVFRHPGFELGICCNDAAWYPWDRRSFSALALTFSGYLNQTLGWSPLITVPLGAILGGAFCTLLLVPVLRLRGIYFSMVTLVLP